VKRDLQPPLLTLRAEVLLARLAEEYMFAELFEAIVQSYAGENEARLRAMTAAHSHIETMSETLAARARLVRQEEITSEILELITGRLAGRAVASRR
jgi:F-type H+-transporting ATPase subunit gamma